MTPLTTRARELAARERKLYDQRTIPAVMEELADEVERLTAELASIRAADRTSITVRTTEAAKMRKGQAI